MASHPPEESAQKENASLTENLAVWWLDSRLCLYVESGSGNWRQLYRVPISVLLSLARRANKFDYASSKYMHWEATVPVSRVASMVNDDELGRE